jgi:glycosyltransferase
VKISVITTCFNAVNTIQDCLESVKGQSYGDVEHIVIDGASTDGTLAILDEYKGVLARIVSEPDKGIYDGMNKGLRLATGDVIGILNADDMYASVDILEKVSRVFEDRRIDSCYGDLVYVADEELRCTVNGVQCAVKGEGQESQVSGFGFQVSGTRGKEEVRGSGCEVHGVRERFEVRGARFEERGKAEEGFRVVRYWRAGEFDYRKFWWGWMVPHPTFFVRREVYERYGGFNLDLGTAADYELMLRFLVKNRITCAYLPEILIMMRRGGASNATLARRIQANRMDRNAWEVNGLKPLPWTMWLKPLRKVGQWFSKPPVLNG